MSGTVMTPTPGASGFGRQDRSEMMTPAAPRSIAWGTKAWPSRRAPVAHDVEGQKHVVSNHDWRLPCRARNQSPARSSLLSVQMVPGMPGEASDPPEAETMSLVLKTTEYLSLSKSHGNDCVITNLLCARISGPGVKRRAKRGFLFGPSFSCRNE